MHGLEASYETRRADFVDAAVDGPTEIKLRPGWKQPPGGPAHGASARRAVPVPSGALPLELCHEVSRLDATDATRAFEDVIVSEHS